MWLARIPGLIKLILWFDGNLLAESLNSVFSVLQSWHSVSLDTRTLSSPCVPGRQKDGTVFGHALGFFSLSIRLPNCFQAISWDAGSPTSPRQHSPPCPSTCPLSSFMILVIHLPYNPCGIYSIRRRCYWGTTRGCSISSLVPTLRPSSYPWYDLYFILVCIRIQSCLDHLRLSLKP